MHWLAMVNCASEVIGVRLAGGERVDSDLACRWATCRPQSPVHCPLAGPGGHSLGFARCALARAWAGRSILWRWRLFGSHSRASPRLH